ncbi:Beta-lactamase enzyme family protein [Flavobacteriaceae bacterium MAR_2010_188]|nr:Beta-lactamase enzyme family protein [Flavobacteriaceae bacterium MAR_2010_188]
MKRVIFLILILCVSCQQEVKQNPIEAALNSNDDIMKKVLEEPSNYELQIKLSTINRENESVSFDDFEYRVDDRDYFYPASTVKFPIALLALEKIDSLEKIKSTTNYILEGDSITHTIRDDIRQIFAVSDNGAFNRLYEFLGRDYINDKLKTKQIGPAHINHRLSVPNSTYRYTRPISYWENDSIIYIQDSLVDSEVETLQLKQLQKGKGYYLDSTLVKEPMDFSKKNYFPISTLHELMKRVIFPESFPEDETFNINQADREFLLNSMKALPREVGYDEVEYYDSYGKFFMFGDSKERIPDNIKIFNKVGYAYGYLTDCSYIKDEKSGVEYILTATLFVNKNGIFNDDTYEFETIGIPFLSKLGKEIHNHLIEQE